MFVGMLLIGPLALKLGSTGYRFVRYYTGESTATGERARPRLALRLIAPLVVLTTLDRVRKRRRAAARRPELARHAAADPQGQLLRLGRIHGDPRARAPARRSLHALRCRLRPAGAPERDQLGGRRLPGRSGRALSLLGALEVGVVLAILVIPQFAPVDLRTATSTTDRMLLTPRTTDAKARCAELAAINRWLIAGERRADGPCSPRQPHRRSRARRPQARRRAMQPPPRPARTARHATPATHDRKRNR